MEEIRIEFGLQVRAAVTPFVGLMTGQRKKENSSDEVVMANRAKTDGERLQVGSRMVCNSKVHLLRSGQREPY